MEIENAILQDLESFRKERLFQHGYERVLDFCLEKLLSIFICYVCSFCY